MKSFFLLAVADFFLFSCSSVQEESAPADSMQESLDTEEEAAAEQPLSEEYPLESMEFLMPADTEDAADDAGASRQPAPRVPRRHSAASPDRRTQPAPSKGAAPSRRPPPSRRVAPSGGMTDNEAETAPSGSNIY